MLFIMTSTSAFADSLKVGATGDQIKAIQAKLADLGYFNEVATGYYGKVTEKAVLAFQTANGITPDGNVGAETYGKLFPGKPLAITATQPSTNENGQLLDWWTQASEIFTIGTKAKVTDVSTGKVFYIIRTYGKNHADCEAATKSDTSIIKDLWGGNWSWDRRPVVITIGDTKIAASIAAMPHAGLDSKDANKYISSRSGGYGRGQNLDKIKNNNMNGVIDVHFLNSRTHNTNKIDNKHQAAVLKAAGK